MESGARVNSSSASGVAHPRVEQLAIMQPLPSFFCKISDEIMRDPVFSADGHTYERAQIEQWLARHDTSPATGARLPHKDLVPNFALRQAIEEWEKTHAMHIRRADVELPERPISEGSFKTVYKGTLRVHVSDGQTKTQTVAVLKMRKGDCSTEARTFLKLGRHPRLVRFHGQCIDGEEQLLVTEFAERGSLSDAFAVLEDDLTLDHMVVMMMQIGQAMEHLAAEGITHRDLAARNVLVFGFDKQDVRMTSVKVTDYGLAVGLYGRSHVTLGSAELPVRWMPPESLQKGRFGEKSDVWACGVTLWEILTRGNIPYFHIVADDRVLAHVCGGARLPREQITSECPDRLWAVMSSCWSVSPKDRPTFSELVVALGAIRGEAPAAGAEARRSGQQARSPALSDGAAPEGQERAKQEQERQDAELARALQQQLQMEEEEARARAEQEKQESEEAALERTMGSLQAQEDIPALVQIMGRFPAHAGIQAKGCETILSLTPSAVGDEWRAIWGEDGERWKRMDEQYKALASAGVIGVVCRAISINASVAATACRILWFLARSDDNQVKIAEQGGIRALLDAMRNHSSHAGVQEAGCWALLGVGWSNQDLQRQIKEAGGEAAVRSAMSASNATPNTQEMGQALLLLLGLIG